MECINCVDAVLTQSITLKFMDLKKYKDNPPHIFISGAKYFITGATYNKIKYFKSIEAKEAIKKYMLKSFSHYSWEIEDWVLLDNHYHVLANAPKSAVSLQNVIKNFHRFSALWIRKNIKNINCVDAALTQSMHSKNKLKIWYNYWDTCITFERSYFARLNYIWYNPVKHGYVENAEDWQFGSYISRIKNDFQYINEIRKTYPFDKINIEDNY